MSFRQIGRNIKNALQSIPETGTKITNTLVGKIENENIVEVKGVRYRKIKLRIVDNASPDTEKQIERLLDKLARRNHRIEVLFEYNQIKKQKIIDLQNELHIQTNNLHLENVKLHKENLKLIQELNDQQIDFNNQQSKYLSQIEQLNKRLNNNNHFQFVPYQMKAENDLLKMKNKKLVEQLSEKIIPDIPENWNYKKEEYEATINAQLKTIAKLEARLNDVDHINKNNVLTPKQIKAISKNNKTDLTIKDLEFKLTDRNTKIKDLHLQASILKQEFASQLKMKNKEIALLQTKKINKQMMHGELLNA